MRSSTLRTGLVALLFLGLTACGSRDIAGSAYLDTSPEFKLTEFFDGDVRAWGIVQDRSGNITQRFIADIDGTWDGETLTLDETFEYLVGDGVTERVWTISRDANGEWQGGAGDILGQASGATYGNAFNWTYQMDLPVDDTSYVVNFDDWIWAFDEDTIMNRSYITKFGITFAEVTIFMSRQR